MRVQLGVCTSICSAWRAKRLQSSSRSTTGAGAGSARTSAGAALRAERSSSELESAACFFRAIGARFCRRREDPSSPDSSSLVVSSRWQAHAMPPTHIGPSRLTKTGLSSQEMDVLLSPGESVSPVLPLTAGMRPGLHVESVSLSFSPVFSRGICESHALSIQPMMSVRRPVAFWRTMFCTRLSLTHSNFARRESLCTRSKWRPSAVSVSSSGAPFLQRCSISTKPA
mmetsp:Transcript_55216/g.142208  ORF Transcript_55216/g.142208 Transcript_55216/m.142208 type:complete len:227 (+) Transcript_55216:215-895(+)